MRRKIEDKLLAWKESKRRKPLMVMGARQVGKTYSVLRFAEIHYDNVVHIDFSAQRQASAVFEGDITPDALLPQLSAFTRQKIVPGSTLIFLDEAQLCPRAVASLKHFCERAPEQHVIAAGSLLGLTLARGDELFPVGKIDMLEMHPLDFEEFLWANGDEGLAREIGARSHFFAGPGHDDFKMPLHEVALARYQDYLFCGGMPESVIAAVDGAADDEIRTIQSTLETAYVADMVKYAAPIDSARILGVWRAVPEQLAKENHKFQYSTIASSARAHKYEEAINWLIASGLVVPSYRVREGLAPLKAYEERDFFKLYIHDVGMLGQMYGLRREDLLPASDKGSRYRGGIAENFVAQQLLANGIDLHYWGTASRSEVDFVFQHERGWVIPVEVKSGKNVTSKSLLAYRRAYNPRQVYRLSRRNFGTDNVIYSLPIYAAFCLG